MKINLLGILLLLSACSATPNAQTLKIDGYNCNEMQKVHLEHDIDEVSGIVFYKKDNSFLCIDDEHGNVYKLDNKEYKITHKYKFAKSGDYESISIDGNNVYVINSKGDLWRFKIADDIVINPIKYDSPVKGIEFEATIFSKKENKLYLISKFAKSNKKKKATQVFVFDNKHQIFNTEQTITIKWSSINNILNDNEQIENFHPSAAAIHSKTGHIYLVSSIEKLLIVLNMDWEVQKVFSLKNSFFKQPEGITFDNDNNLYITNEADGGRPNIVRIPRNKQ